MTDSAFPTAAEVAAGALAAAREADPDRLRAVVRDFPNAVAAKIARHELERRGLEIEPDAGTTSVRVGIVVEHPGGITADLAAVSVNAVVVSKRAGNVYDRQAIADDLAAHLRAALAEWTAANPGMVWDDYAGLFTVDPGRLTKRSKPAAGKHTVKRDQLKAANLLARALEAERDAYIAEEGTPAGAGAVAAEYDGYLRELRSVAEALELPRI